VKPPRSRRIAIIDVTFVVAISVTYVGLELLHIQKRWSFLAAGLALLTYILYLVRRRPHTWRDLGFRRDNIVAGLVPVGASTLLVGAALVAFAVERGRPIGQPTVLVLLALYPLWALAQQFAFQGLLHRGLSVLIRAPWLQVLITAAAFASVHAGNPTLLILTFAAGVMWSLLYRRWPNLWLLAGSHTILAAIAYPLVLGDAPLSRV
jgi:CAAX prenyl protease-like protein